MSALANVRTVLAENARLLMIVALVLIVLFAIGYVLFARFVILPQISQRQQLVSQVAEARSSALNAERAAARAPEETQQQLQAANAELEEIGDAFLTEAQAAQILDRLYEYAENVGVEIITLESQPEEDEKSETFDARAFQIEVAGELVDLMRFVAQFREASARSVNIRNVNIPAAEQEPHQLTMTLIIYTSPYAAAEEAPSAPLPTSAATPQTSAQLQTALSAAWNAGEWDSAIHLIEQILAGSPQQDDMLDRLYTARVNYGYDLLSQDRQQDAARQFRLALELKPNGPEALLALSELQGQGTMPTATAAPGQVVPIASPPAQATPTSNNYLVRPENWPTDWPWPPQGD